MKLKAKNLIFKGTLASLKEIQEQMISFDVPLKTM